MLSLAAPGEDRKASEDAVRRAEAEARELKSILDTATDGVIVLDRDGRILASNRSAEALFGYESHDFAATNFADLFAPESQRVARDYLDRLTRDGVRGRAQRRARGRRAVCGKGGMVPLFMTMGRIGEATQKFCAVFRDVTQWKKAEEELLNAKRQAEKASSAKSEFLAKISHEIRTPLNAIIGFSEVMMEERFGPIGNERYREYLKDIHTSGAHLVSLLNDLLDLSKIEAGKLDLTFVGVKLNDLTQQCVALMQPQANRERIIIRSSLSPILPQIVADARSIRQIVLNLLSNSIKFTGAGGQVIVSTAHADNGEVVLRVRDTGIGMSEKDIEIALEPFRQLATSARWGSSGTGLGLPLTKALAEANRARFSIKSAVNAGTLVEIAFPAEPGACRVKGACAGVCHRPRGASWGMAMMRIIRSVLALLALSVTLSSPLARASEQVDLLLVLAADVSRSVDGPKFKLQREGYAAAITNPQVLEAISSGLHRRIAVCFVEWSGASAQRLVIDWMLISDAASAQKFADALIEAPRSFADRTSISAGIDFAMVQLARAPYAGQAPHHRRVRRRDQQFRPRRLARPRRCRRQGNHHQRPRHSERAAAAVESGAHQSAGRARELLPQQRHRRTGSLRHGRREFRVIRPGHHQEADRGNRATAAAARGPACGQLTSIVDLRGGSTQREPRTQSMPKPVVSKGSRLEAPWNYSKILIFNENLD